MFYSPRASRIVAVAAALCFLASSVVADDLQPRIDAALSNAKTNRAEIERALRDAPESERAGIRFLVAYMPERDVQTLTAEFLLTNTKWAYRAWREAPWAKDVPPDVFLNDVLPYANINERRDDWREDFYRQFKPLVKDAKTPAEAAAILNQKVFPLLKVRYSTKRKKADQSPYESIEGGLASCTGLSILLIDACRAVGVPARFVGTPLWSDMSGNHSWVEVWDQGWHFTGAAEPTGDNLDRAWFINRASKAQRGHRLHAIYAISFRETPGGFPIRWRQGEELKYIHTVNVTDRYTQLVKKRKPDHHYVRFQVLQGEGGERVSRRITLKDAAGAVVFEGETNDERFDRNDHLTTELPLNGAFELTVEAGDRQVKQTVKVVKDEQLVTVQLGKQE